MTNWIIEYHNHIKSGKIITSKRVAKMYKKLVDDINNPNLKWKFDIEKANKPVTFVETFCKQSKGEWIGKSVELQLFQKAFISALFGFVDKETGVRRFKETMFLVGRKNGKSTLLSGIALYMLMADNEGGSEVYSVATKKDQAKLTFTEAVNMVKQSPSLSKHLKKRKTDIYFPLTFSKFEALASDSNSLDGLNSHCVIIDELHAIKDRNLYEVMKQSMSARKQPLLVMITTAGTVRENIYDDMYEYAYKVVDGLIDDDRFLPILYELDSTEEWTDWKCWVKANPGLGTIKKLEDITEKVERCKVNPKDLSGVLCKDFNLRQNTSEAWLTFDDINNEDTFTMDDIKDCYCVGGVDLSITTDLTCATLIIMKSGSEKKYILQHYFIPANAAEKKIKEDNIRYDIYKEQGYLTYSGEDKIDYSDVTAWFVKMLNDYGLRPIWTGYDPYNSTYWIKEMQDCGFNMEEVRQGTKTLSSPMKLLEGELKSKLINYNNSNLLKWNLGNLAIKTDINCNIQPIKQNNKMRIDGAVSLIIAYTVLMNHYSDYKALI